MATSSLFGSNNFAKTATIVAGSASTNLPALNVAADSGAAASGWQTVYGVVTSAGGATLTITPTSPGLTWGAVGIFRTNLTSAASVTFTLYLAGAAVWSTVVAGPIPGYGQVIALPSSIVADYLVIGIDDSANPDGFLNIPLVFCGAVWKPLGAASYASTVGRDATVNEVVTRGGAEFPSLQFQRRRWNIQLDSLRSSETWQQADPLLMYAAAGSNVLFVPDVASSYLQQEAMFGRLKPSADVSYPYLGADRRRVAMVLTERL